VNKTYLAKIEAWGYRIVNNPDFNHFSMIHPCGRQDGQIERREDGRAIAYSAVSICYMLSRAKNRPVMHFMSSAKQSAMRKHAVTP